MPTATATNGAPSANSRRERLKIATHDIHEQLDQRIMAFRPFSSRERYTAFLMTQYRLHRDVQALYADPALNRVLPHLSERSRLSLVEQDLKDMGLEISAADLDAPYFDLTSEKVLKPETPELATALGWLYTVEGSNIGAAFLLKAAAALGLDATFGARHLAPHADGRARHWKDFIGQLDDVALSADGEAYCIAGANTAFSTALGYVSQYCILPSTQAD